LQKNANTDEENTCEFHPVEILFNERPFVPNDIQYIKRFIQMKTIAIHQKEDWFMIQLPGYGSKGHKQMEVEINIPDKDDEQPDYKTLRHDALLDRYLEKQKREITEEPDEVYTTAFDLKFGTADINSIDDVLNTI